MAPADSTPGVRSSRSSTASVNVRKEAASGYRVEDRNTCPLITPSVRMPMSERCSCTKLRSVSVAPASSTIAVAVSATIRSHRTRGPADPPAAPFGPSRSEPA